MVTASEIYMSWVRPSMYWIFLAGIAVTTVRSYPKWDRYLAAQRNALSKGLFRWEHEYGGSVEGQCPTGNSLLRLVSCVRVDGPRH
jgi:hypothetical protein